jgi:hypothetical protein
MKTRVIFRKFREKGEVIALFPDEQADNNTLNCLSYMHVGQHSAASFALVSETLPATRREYAELKRELQGIGYDLRVGKRITNRRTA